MPDNPRGDEKTMTAPRLKSRRPAVLLLGLASLFVILAAAAPAMGQATGSISGRITEAATGRPMAYANVTVLGTGR